VKIVSPKLVLSVAGVIVLFIFISLAQEMNRRLSVQREVAALESEAKALEKKLIEMENLNQYFRTDAFQELMARQKLNYSKPGEKVVLLPAEEPEREQAASGEAEERAVPIPLRWWRAFYGG